MWRRCALAWPHPSASAPLVPDRTHRLRSIIHNLCAERSCNEHDFSPAKDDRDDDDNEIIVRGGRGREWLQAIRFGLMLIVGVGHTHTGTWRRKDLMESIEILRNKLERGGGRGCVV